MGEPILQFKYPGPEGTGFRVTTEGGRRSFTMCQTENVVSTVQVLTPGDHNDLHSHGTEDGYWLVLAGRATFYEEGDKVIASLGAHEGLLIPAGTPYWFGSVGPEPLQILRVNYQVRTAVPSR